MARQIRQKDWTSTALGAIDTWPAELCSTLSLILESKFPYFVAWGSDFVCLFNDAYAPFVEDKPWALGSSFPEVWAEAWSTVGPVARAALAGTSSYFEDLPIRMARADRWQQTWWTFCYSPIRLRDGSVGGVLCTVVETTQHKLLERRLEQSETSLRRFNDLVPQMLWEADANGRFRYMNRRMLTSLGFASAEEAPEWPAFVHPDDIATVIAANAGSIDAKCGFECQHRMLFADGGYRWVLARAEPVFEPNGDLSGWYGAATDIHEWRLSVEQLRSSEEMVRRFAENAGRILWISDLQSGAVEFLNAAGRNFWQGEPGGEILGWDQWLAIVHPDHHALIEDAVDRLRSGETVAATYRVRDNEHVFHDMRATLFPILEADGGFTKFGGIAEMIDRPPRRLVHLVDPDRDAHRQLSAVLWTNGFEVRGFTDVHAFSKVAPALLPGCVIIRAVSHTAWTGRVVAAARQQRGRLPVVVLTDQHRDADHVRELMKQGASDVLPHDAGWEQLAAAIADASEELLEAEGGGRSASGKLALLSSREREILKLLMNGATNKIVALQLNISPRTVEAHRARIIEKLEVSSIAEAIAIAASASS